MGERGKVTLVEPVRRRAIRGIYRKTHVVGENKLKTMKSSYTTGYKEISISLFTDYKYIHTDTRDTPSSPLNNKAYCTRMIDLEGK